MPPHELTEQQQAFLEGYKALCEAHGIEFDVSGYEYDVELAAFVSGKRPGLWHHFDDFSTGAQVHWETISSSHENRFLSKKIREQALMPPRLMTFLQRDE